MSVGCSSAPSTLRVPSAALDSIRSIGKTRAEISVENEGRDTTQIEHVLVIDIGSPDNRGAFDKAADLLLARKWEVVGERLPLIVLLKSPEWKNTNLTLCPYSAEELEQYPELMAQLKEPVNEESLVYLSVFEGEI
ncbi:hypothetical protein ACFQ08_01440 [Streptosporangium algeriense]|uniref:Uncharacterized protein n=1 Tax=Streptosporangium algeriense TaxID=1682748 RepID=A0ABW3DJ54_9ACTN